MIQLGGASLGGVGQIVNLIVDHFSSNPIPIPPGTTAGVNNGTGVAVRAADVAGGQQTGESLQSFFNVESLLGVVMGDVIQSHGSGGHAFPRMAEGLSWFKLNGIPACRAGHNATCGHQTTGRSWWRMSG